MLYRLGPAEESAKQMDNAQNNIYRLCRNRANETDADNAFSSREKTCSAFSANSFSMSAASLKDYETGKTTPSPDIVLAMAETYKTPELKWMHCSTMCPIGQEVAKADPGLGMDDIHLTYFELAVSFSKVAQMESNLREIISDEKLSSDEVPIMEEILAVMDRITENAKDLRIWIEKQNRDNRE